MKMMRRFLYLSLAFGAMFANGAVAEVPATVPGEEGGLGMSRNELFHAAVTEAPGGEHSSGGGNPLWGIPLSALTATRERPVFSETRRAPAPPPPPAPPPEAESPAPSPAAPEDPLLTLVGTATGQTDSLAVVRDETTKKLIRLHMGEAVSGWLLRSVASWAMTLEKDGRIVTLALPAASNSVPPSSADFAKEAPAGGAS